jgi:hypothetical protein
MGLVWGGTSRDRETADAEGAVGDPRSKEPLRSGVLDPNIRVHL